MGYHFCMMKRSKKKLISLILMLALAASVFGACRKKPQETTAPERDAPLETGGEQSGEETEGTAPEAAEGETIPEGSTFRVRFIDVGQGDSALILCDGHSMLIDGGLPDASSKIYNVLSKEGIEYLDYVVATHRDGDHVGGLAAALKKVPAGHVLCSTDTGETRAWESFKKYVDQRGLTIEKPAPGDVFRLGSAVVTVIGPVQENEENNNNSIVLRIVYGKTSFLFTGDCERPEEMQILLSKPELESDVLKVGHHGSYTSTSYVFLRAIMPTYAVISCAKNSEYGHPHSEVLSRLRDADCVVFRTDLQGDILFMSDGQSLTYMTERQATREELLKPGGKW